jgi:hypothetical protein
MIQIPAFFGSGLRFLHYVADGIGVGNLIFAAFLVLSLAQAGWIQVTQGSPEAWLHAGPRLGALLMVMLIAEGLRRLLPVFQTGRQAAAWSGLALALTGLLGVLTCAAFFIVTTDGGDVGWCLIALICVAAQATATAPVLLARKRNS